MPLADPATAHTPVVVIVTPGFAAGNFAPLVERLRRHSHTVVTVEFAVDGQDSAKYTDQLVAALAPYDHPVIVAHGLGGTLALMAAPRVEPERLVLLSPVVGVMPLELHDVLADAPLTGPVDLGQVWTFHGSTAADIFLGKDGPELGMIPLEFARELQQWVHDKRIPLDLAAVAAPTWIASSLGDQLAPVQVIVPMSRAIPHRALVRLGLNRFDPQDYSHGEMLTERLPERLAVQAVRQKRWVREVTP